MQCNFVVWGRVGSSVHFLAVHFYPVQYNVVQCSVV